MHGLNSGDLNADKYYWRTNMPVLKSSLKHNTDLIIRFSSLMTQGNVTLKSVTYTVVEETVDVSGDYHYALGQEILLL